MDSNFEQARAFFLEGVARFQAGQLVQAEQKFAAALALVPGRPSTLTNLGAVRLKLGRADEALALLEEAVAREPDNVEALGLCATALAQTGRPREALPLFDRALAAQPAQPTLWMLRGTALRELGRPAEAAASFRQSLAHGGDAALNRYYLAGVGEAAEVPPAAPLEYVQALFDGYADRFDGHLVQALRYDAPRLLCERLAARGRRWQHALDLGCGTGLAGPHLRALAQRITGVDVSANMLDRARAGGCYDTLQQADVVAFLAEASAPADLVLAADVFVYVGALEPVFAQLARLVPAGGVFCFTVEASDGEALALRSTLRYAHSETSIRELAATHGFAVTALERAPVRHDQGAPVAGLFVWLERR